MGRPAHKFAICDIYVRDDGEGRTRTGDTPVFSRVLYQLSYLAAGGAQSSQRLSSQTLPSRTAP
jgi:hypothetical protein